MISTMKTGWAAKVAGVAAALAMSGTIAVAQYGPPPPGPYQGQYPGQFQGQYAQDYAGYYREQPGRPMLGARQGWVAGVAQGESDRELGHSFRPTHVDTFRHVPESPGGYPRDLFKQEYRDAFIRGYGRGYGR